MTVSTTEPVAVDRTSVTSSDGADFSWLGNSPDIAALLTTTQRVAQAHTRAPVLLVGEPGLRKDRIASFIHQISGRRGLFAEISLEGAEPGTHARKLFGYTSSKRDIVAGTLFLARGGTAYIGQLHLADSDAVRGLRRLLTDRTLLTADEQPHRGPLPNVVASCLPASCHSGFPLELLTTLAWIPMHVSEANTHNLF